MLWVVQCEELLITKLINSSVFHLDIFIYIVGNMIVCCINSKTYFVLEQITNTLKDLFNVARSENFFPLLHWPLVSFVFHVIHW